MKTNINRRAIIVGLFIFLGIMFLLAGILTIGNLHTTFTKKIVVATVFDDVNGLQPGNNIWFSGVKVGTVNQLDFYGKSQVRVLMKINEKSQQYIRKDAKVKISTDGLIGNKILIIYGGSESAPQVEDGDSLGIEKLLSTDDMMKTLNESNKNLLEITNSVKDISKKIASGEGSIGKLLNDDSIYHTILITIESLKQASVNARQLTASLSDYGSKLNDKGTLANDLVTDTIIFPSIRNTVTHLNQIASDAAELTTNLKEASTDPNTPVGVLFSDKESADHLKSAISNLDSSSQKLDEDLEALQHNFFLRGYFKDQEKADEKKKK